MGSVYLIIIAAGDVPLEPIQTDSLGADLRFHYVSQTLRSRAQ